MQTDDAARAEHCAGVNLVRAGVSRWPPCQLRPPAEQRPGGIRPAHALAALDTRPAMPPDSDTAPWPTTYGWIRREWNRCRAAAVFPTLSFALPWLAAWAACLIALIKRRGSMRDYASEIINAAW